MLSGKWLGAGSENSVIVPVIAMRPIRLRLASVNQSAPSGPADRGETEGPALGFGVENSKNSVTTPPVVIRPIFAARTSMNHRAPSGPAMIPVGSTKPGEANSLNAPVVVMRPTLAPVNHSAPSGPVAMRDPPLTSLREAVSGNSVTTPPVEIRPIRFAPGSVNHNALSDPRVIDVGYTVLVGSAYSVITPLVVMRPIRLPSCSVNQSAPSGPGVMPPGWPPAVGSANSVMTPAVVIRPIRLPSCSVNHSAPSGPDTMSVADVSPVGIRKFVRAPVVVIRQIKGWRDAVNQRAPSGPAAMPTPKSGPGKSVTLPPGVIRPIRPPEPTNHMAPSGPAVMEPAPLGVGNMVMTPPVVLRPIRPPGEAVNHIDPSGPAARPVASAKPSVRGNSVIAPVWALPDLGGARTAAPRIERIAASNTRGRCGKFTVRSSCDYAPRQNAPSCMPKSLVSPSKTIHLGSPCLPRHACAVDFSKPPRLRGHRSAVKAPVTANGAVSVCS